MRSIDRSKMSTTTYAVFNAVFINFSQHYLSSPDLLLALASVLLTSAKYCSTAIRASNLTISVNGSSSIVGVLFAILDCVQCLLATDGYRVANVSLFVFGHASTPPTLISAAEKMTRKNLAKMRGSKLVSITAPVFSGLPAPHADVARKLTFTVKTEGLSLPNQFVRVARGRVVVEIYTQQTVLSDEALLAVAEVVFRRLPQEFLSGSAPGR